MLNPSMGIRSILSLCSAKNYTFSANSKLSFSTGYTTSIGDMMTLLTEPMQVDYRSVRTSSGIIGEQNTWHTSGEWKWQLPMQYFTLSLAASHSEGKQNTLTSQSVSGIDVSSTALLRDSRSLSTSFSVAATKNIPTLFAKLGADGSYSFGSGEQAISSSMGGRSGGGHRHRHPHEQLRPARQRHHPPVETFPRFYLVLLRQPIAPMESDGMSRVYQM